jgi:hypothetical protein
MSRLASTAVLHTTMGDITLALNYKEFVLY